MANPAHLAKFYEGVEAWNLWREKNPNITPDLTEARLRGADLSGANLWGASLKGADLREANLKEAGLVKANLEGANLQRANLSGANLWGASLKRADLLEASLKRAHLREANMKEANIVLANLKEAELRGANLKRGSLREANLKGADLLGANLNGANLWAANLSGANLWGASLKGAFLRETNLKEAGLREANLKRADLAKADIKGSILRKQKTMLHGANLRGAYGRGIKYNRWAHFQGIRVHDCYGSARFKRFAQDQDFIEEFKDSKFRFPIYLIWLILADCGRSLLLWVLWSIALITFFAYKFYNLGDASFFLDKLDWGFGAMIYYSMVTFAPLGFGSIKPMTMEAAWWVMAEVIFGYLMLGGLISILLSKLARRG